MPPSKVPIRSDQNGIPVPVATPDNFKGSFCTATSVEQRVLFTEGITGLAVATYDPLITTQDNQVNRTLYNSPDMKVPDAYYDAIKNVINMKKKGTIYVIVASKSFADTDAAGLTAWQGAVMNDGLPVKGKKAASPPAKPDETSAQAGARLKKEEQNAASSRPVQGVASTLRAIFSDPDAVAKIKVLLMTSQNGKDDAANMKPSGFAIDQMGNWGRIWNGKGTPPVAAGAKTTGDAPDTEEKDGKNEDGEDEKTEKETGSDEEEESEPEEEDDDDDAADEDDAKDDDDKEEESDQEEDEDEDE
jgi:hypothetical protein